MNPQDDYEDDDYDPFAEWRPRGLSVDDNPQDQSDGQYVEDYWSQFAPQESQPEQEKQSTSKQVVKDFAKQAGKEFLIGLGGTWGDLVELAGARQEPTEAENIKTRRDFDTLSRMREPGYEPSWEDAFSLSSDDEGPIRLPTSRGLRELNEVAGGPGEPETAAGRYGGRIGRLAGGAASLGAVSPAAALGSAVAGAAGQTVEEAGGGPLAQTAAEVAGFLLSPGSVGKKLAPSMKKQVNEKINALRKLGYSDEDITLAINSASQGKKVLKASKGESTKEAFEKVAKRSDEMVEDILFSGVPGLEKGTKYVHELANQAYREMLSDAGNIVIKDATPFIESATQVVQHFNKNLGRDPKYAKLLERIKEAVIESTKNPTAENMTGFYRELNALGNWENRTVREAMMEILKKGVTKTFANAGPEGKKLADKFVEANKGITKAYQASDMNKLMKTVRTQDGIDYTKMSKMFDKEKNVETFEKVLGEKTTNNLKLIAKTGKQIKDFDKAWKGIDLIKGSRTGNIGSLAYLLLHQNIPGVIAAAGVKLGESGARRLAEVSLTNPRFQNLMVRGLHAVKNQSGKALVSVLKNMEDELEEEGINLDLVGPI